MSGPERNSPSDGVPVRLSNRERTPVRVRTARAPMASLVSDPVPQLRTLTAGHVTRADLASGRPLTYEWEFFVDDLYSELAAAGIGPQTFEFNQVVAASVWTINHALTAFPTVLIVADDGQELLAEVHYPDDQTVVVIHGTPYTGTAYLRI